MLTVDRSGWVAVVKVPPGQGSKLFAPSVCIPLFSVDQGFSKCGPQTSKHQHHLELVRDANSWVSPHLLIQKLQGWWGPKSGEEWGQVLRQGELSCSLFSMASSEVGTEERLSLQRAPGLSQSTSCWSGKYSFLVRQPYV